MTIYSRVTEIVIVITTIVMLNNEFCADASDRKPYKTKEELELTRLDPLIDGTPCAAHDRLVIFVLSAAHKDGKYFDKRQTTRKTWASVARLEYNINVYFVLGVNGTSQPFNEDIQSEAREHSDIIQFSFIDAYHNLTLKSISILRWVSRKCPQLKYILKTDDDIILNVDLLNRTLDQFESGIHGFGREIEKPIRTNSKNAIPINYYPNDTYPKYIHGPAYLLSTDVIDKLLNTIDSYTGFVLDIEDVFIAGIIAEKAGIARHLDSRFVVSYDDCAINPNSLCRMCSHITLLECTNSTKMLKFYEQWQQFDCNCTLSSGETSSLSLNLLKASILLFVILNFN